MNDDFDLDAHLRAGARAYPSAPSPGAGGLRDVLTRSRRRTQRRRGTVLSCATVMVAGGAALAVRGPAEPEQVTVAATVDRSPTSAPPSSAVSVPGVPPSVAELCDDPLAVTEDGDIHQTPDGTPIYVVYGSGWNLDQELPDTAVIIDGADFYVTYGPMRDAILGTDAPTPPRDDDAVFALVVPLLDGEREITVRSDGKERTLTFVAGDDLEFLPPEASPGLPDIGVVRFSVMCGLHGGSVADPTTAHERE